MSFLKFLQRALRKIIKISKLNRLIYKFSTNEFLTVDTQNVNAARELLEKYSPNPLTSCFCENDINIQVDLHIIIPAYNVEKYIKDCLDSVVKNSSKKYTYHVTVVNDGSTDGTATILKDYENRECVEIITQENKGFSGARNTALKNIKGKYVLFLDSDDKLDWNGVEKMLDVAEQMKAQVVIGSHTTINSVGLKKKFFKKKKGLLDVRMLGGQPWAKVFRAELFSNVCFPEKYWYEDSIFTQIVYPNVKLAVGVSENTYFYRVHSKSITCTGRMKPKSIDSYWITEKLFDERKKFGLEITPDYYDYILHMVILTFSRVIRQSEEVKKSLFVLFFDFINTNFEKYETTDNSLKEIENIIKSKNYGKCISYVNWLY